jgi:hypothetical protein
MQSTFFFSSTACDLLNEHLVDKGIGQRTRMERPFRGATGLLKKRSSFRSAVVKRDEVMMKSNIENYNYFLIVLALTSNKQPWA